jgi:hypothetical protein
MHRRPHPATLIDSNIRPDSLDKILFLLTTSPARSTRKMRISRARPPYVNWNAFFLKQSFRRQQSEWAKGDGAFLISRTGDRAFKLSVGTRDQTSKPKPRCGERGPHGFE